MSIVIQIIIWLLSLLAPAPQPEPEPPAPVEHEAEIGTALYCERDLDSLITRCWEDGVEVTP